MNYCEIDDSIRRHRKSYRREKQELDARKVSSV